jgi:hypothetical protein
LLLIFNALYYYLVYNIIVEVFNLIML